MTWAGERSEQPRSFQSPQVFFLLTFPFIERACVYRHGFTWTKSRLFVELTTQQLHQVHTKRGPRGKLRSLPCRTRTRHAKRPEWTWRRNATVL